MTKDEVQKLRHGLYKITWRNNEYIMESLAAIGSYPNGDRWMAPTNWVHVPTASMAYWDRVEKIQLIVSDES